MGISILKKISGTIERWNDMAKKYYAVKKGRVPGIYFTWADCQKNINGFSGAIYKGFATIEEAEAFVNDSNVTDENSESVCLEQTKNIRQRNIEANTEKNLSGLENSENNTAIAYVDGSYNIATREYSYGAVIFYQGKEQHFSKKFANPERATMRNVAGEIEGSMCAMKYCMEQGIPQLTIYYDYEGIERWCTGDWKANKEGTIAYRDFYKEVTKKVQIRFVKVKGHSGDKYNDLADMLAKQAVGLA